MSDAPQTQPPGWYYAQGDPPGTQRYWDGSSWQGGPQPVPGAAMAANDTPAGKLAEPVKRIVARLIDGVLWVIVSVVISVAFGAGVTNTSAGFASLLVASIVTGLLVAAYEIGMIGSQGATLGKMALSIKVVNDDGSPADYMTGLRRNYLYLAFIVISLIPILGALAQLGVAIAGLVMLFTDGKQQTPWDKVGKTLVVDK